MEITTDLLLDCLHLVVNDIENKYHGPLKELLKLHKEQKLSIQTSSDDLSAFYTRMISAFLNDKIDRTNPDFVKDVLLRFKSDVAYSRHQEVVGDLREALKITTEADDEKLRKTALGIENTIKWHRINNQWRRVSARLSRISLISEPDIQSNEIDLAKTDMESILGILNSGASVSTIEPVGTVNFHDRDTIKENLKRNTDRNVRGIIKTGLQGLNRALGKSNGIALGESIIFSALPHMYKSGILISVAMWSIIYNNFDTIGNKKPLIYLVSVENEAFMNMMIIFRRLYFKETGCSPDKLSDTDIEEWIIEYFKMFNATLIIERFLPNVFGYNEFVSRIEFYESLGYYIPMAIIDYMSKMKKEGSSGKGASRDLLMRDLCSALCNYTKNKDITLVTAHALTREAVREKRNTTNAVKKFDSDMMAEGMDIEREADVLIYMHIEKNHAGFPFLTLRLAKHRYVDDTPEAHKYFAYPFIGEEGIKDDLNKAPGFVTDIYAAAFDNLEDPGSEASVMASIF